jgi:ribonuclease HI
LAHNSLPLKKNIEARKIKLDTLCPMCNRFDENAAHTLFHCKAAKAVWCQLQLEYIRVHMAALPSAQEVFYYIWEQKEDLQLKIIIILWVLITERNRVNAKEQKKHSDRIAAEVQCYCNEFAQFFRKSPKHSQRQVQRWAKPAAGYLKFNLDASFREGTQKGGWGFIVRNDQGEGVAAGAGSIAAVDGALQAEALACLQALSFASGQGMMQIEMETDCEILCDAINTNGWDASHVGMIFREIKFLLRSAFNSVSFRYIPRVSNKVAHELAAIGADTSRGGDLFWVHDLPDFVSN